MGSTTSNLCFLLSPPTSSHFSSHPHRRWSVTAPSLFPVGRRCPSPPSLPAVTTPNPAGAAPLLLHEIWRRALPPFSSPPTAAISLLHWRASSPSRDGATGRRGPQANAAGAPLAWRSPRRGVLAWDPTGRAKIWRPPFFSAIGSHLPFSYVGDLLIGPEMPLQARPERRGHRSSPSSARQRLGEEKSSPDRLGVGVGRAGEVRAPMRSVPTLLPRILERPAWRWRWSRQRGGGDDVVC